MIDHIRFDPNSKFDIFIIYGKLLDLIAYQYTKATKLHILVVYTKVAKFHIYRRLNLVDIWWPNLVYIGRPNIVYILLALIIYIGRPNFLFNCKIILI